jgi:hypothetical protein
MGVRGRIPACMVIPRGELGVSRTTWTFVGNTGQPSSKWAEHHVRFFAAAVYAGNVPPVLSLHACKRLLGTFWLNDEASVIATSFIEWPGAQH